MLICHQHASWYYSRTVLPNASCPNTCFQTQHLLQIKGRFQTWHLLCVRAEGELLDGVAPSNGSSVCLTDQTFDRQSLRRRFLEVAEWVEERLGECDKASIKEAEDAAKRDLRAAAGGWEEEKATLLECGKRI